LLDFDFDPQMPAWAKRLAVFDLETTGLDLNTSRIVTACVAVINQNGETESVSEWLVNPGIEIPEAASRVHGVTTEVAREKGAEPASSVQEIVELLRSLNLEMPLVAFNASYDFSILRSEALRYSLEPLDPKPVIDPLVIDRKLERYRSGKKNLATLTQSTKSNFPMPTTQPQMLLLLASWLSGWPQNTRSWTSISASSTTSRLAGPTSGSYRCRSSLKSKTARISGRNWVGQ
jgi:hypothetical protein